MGICLKHSSRLAPFSNWRHSARVGNINIIRALADTALPAATILCIEDGATSKMSCTKASVKLPTIPLRAPAPSHLRKLQLAIQPNSIPTAGSWYQAPIFQPHDACNNWSTVYFSCKTRGLPRSEIPIGDRGRSPQIQPTITPAFRTLLTC